MHLFLNNEAGHWIMEKLRLKEKTEETQQLQPKISYRDFHNRTDGSNRAVRKMYACTWRNFLSAAAITAAASLPSFLGNIQDRTKVCSKMGLIDETGI